MKGKAVQVVQVCDDHTYCLEDAALEKILMREELKDLPVVVISLAGAYRGGKSFMLNFFIRYLLAPDWARKDGSWLGTGAEPLEGFSWRGGSKRNTTGILLWSEPIITTLHTGEKVAVLLMDTQGTFDHKSTVRECSTIFALSTLVSSVQIYNLPGGNVHEDDLQHLQLFTEYGKMVKEQEGAGTAFQVLQFLVRDWPNSFEYAYGCAGGQMYLNDILKIEPDQPKELSDLRRHIRSSFEKVSCFLMPHPGFKVQKPQYTGTTDGLEPDFINFLNELTKSVFGPETMKIKKINGKAVTARELLTYYRSYMKAFISNKITTPVTIMQATAQAGLLVALSRAREQYEAGMEAECSDEAPGLPGDELHRLHLREKQRALDAFQKAKTMGSKEDVEKHLLTLTEEIEVRLPKYMAKNKVKTEKAVAEAIKLYDEKVLSIVGNKMLLVQPIALDRKHNEILKDALQVYDSKRKSSGKDDDRTALIQSLSERYKQAVKTNEQNNQVAVFQLLAEYRRRVEGGCTRTPPVPRDQFHLEHREALAGALARLDSMRAAVLPSDPADNDIYKKDLTEKINEHWEHIRKVFDDKVKLLDERKREQEKALAREQELNQERERVKKREEELEKERERERERARQRERELERERERAQNALELERSRMEMMRAAAAAARPSYCDAGFVNDMSSLSLGGRRGSQPRSQPRAAYRPPQQMESWVCRRCSRVCGSRIGLWSHENKCLNS